MSQQLRFLVLAVFVSTPVTFFAPDAAAALIRGKVKAPAAPQPARTLGYTRTRIAGPSIGVRAKKEELALYLKVKKSLPIPPPNTKREIQILGVLLRPSVMACVFDEAVVFVNDDRQPVEVTVGGQSIGKIAPGQSATYECKESGFKDVRLAGWPHARGTLFVGEVGVVARPDTDGNFELSAPDGTYELEVIGAERVVQKTDVTVSGRDVQLGLIGAEERVEAVAAAEAPPAAAPEPPPPPPPVAAPPPPPPPAPEPVVEKRPPPPPPPPKAKPKKEEVAKKPPPPPKPAAAKPEKAKPKKSDEQEALDDFFEMEQ